MHHRTLDRVGFWSSLICGIHCLATPLVVILFPYIGMMIFANEVFEHFFIITSCLMALASVCYGFTKHRRCWIFIPLSLGILVLLVGFAHHEHNDAVALRNFFGGICIAFSHFVNSRLCRSCSTCQH